MRRSLAAVVALAVLLAGCPASGVKEHSAGDAPSSVTVKALWKDPQGKKLLVAGVTCWLQRIEGQARPLVASETTTTDAPLVFADVKPGRYRLKATSGTFDKVSEEFVLEPGRRVTMRIDVEAAETRQHAKDTAEAIGEGALKVAIVGGAILLLGGLVALAIAVDNSTESK